MENVEDIYELSPVQQGMLFHTLLAPGSGMYVSQAVFALDGELAVGPFTRAWQRLVERHPVLRSAFVWDDLEKPLQVVYRQVELPVAREDWRGLDATAQRARLTERLAATRQSGFALSRPPLAAVTLIRTGEQVHWLLFAYHHLLLDGWSDALLRRELLACYRAYCRGEAPELPAARPYGDYIGWLQQQDLAAAESFWRRELAGFAAPTPLSPARPPGAGRERPGAAASRPFALSPPATAALHAFARRHSLTAGLLLAAAWGVLLVRYSGEDDVVFGITVSGRPAELAGALAMVGPFINSLPLRVRTPWRRRVLPWLSALRARYLELLRHEYSPLVEIQGWSEVPRGLPLFESLLVYQNFPRAAGDGDAGAPLRFTDLASSGRASFPLAVCLADRAAGLGGAFDYDTDRCDRLLVGGMARHFATLLEALVADPERELADLPLLAAAERQQLLVEWNDTGSAREAGATVAGLWEAQVARTPEAVAVRFRERRLTYRELDRRANRLAHHLRARGVGPEVRVAVAVERSPELIVALLAVLKAGGAHVTLDPAHPPQRLAYVLADSAAAVVVTEEPLLGRLGGLPAGAATVVCLDRDREAIAGRPEENPPPLADPANLAYVFYTSGSTGRPKAVAIAHRSCAALLGALAEVFAGEELAAVLATTSAVFDCAVFEIYLPLVRGGTVVLAGSALDLLALDRAAEVTLVNVGPSALTELLAASPLPVAVRTVHVSGEAPSAQLVAELYRRGVERVWNGYGPTEDTTLSTLCRLGRDEAGAPPIGRPLAGGAIFLVDAQGRPTPPGVPGEIWLAGAGLARGYLGRPELTAEKFRPLPWSDEGGERAYATGDLARFLPDGRLEFLGRIDQQIKLRGVRIEPGEIEAVLGEHPAVAQAAAVVREDRPGDRRLVAYVVAAAGRALDVGEMRAYLEERLPAALVPSALVELAALPLTPSGKLDRRALPPPAAGSDLLAAGAVAPRDALERELVEIWEEVLGVAPLGVRDDFFRRGGHSLLAVRLMSQVERRLRHKPPLAALFAAPTVERFAALLRREPGAAGPPGPLVEMRPGGTRPPLFLVHPVGGNVLCYAQLVRHLAAGRPVYGLQARGLDGGEEPPPTIAAMADDYIAALLAVAPHGPYLLGGWSMGGVVAFEMGRRLQARGETVGPLLLIDTPPPGCEPPPDAALLAALAADLGVPREALAPLAPGGDGAAGAGSLPPDLDVDHLLRLHRLYRAHHLAMGGYRPVPSALGAVLLCPASGPRSAPLGGGTGWGPFAVRGVSLEEVPGDHQTMLREPEVRVLAARLDRLLDEAGGGA